ncbi:hypothetical protein [uncultured Succiniclasticum sp.]|uniref:hypothetical protein n=1 Tax=uncultured Succiniclasticum sp. TaxID=1500547 RepID=UPI0026014824|nr:hypothetical protein [uncultured Succiniclasticum sp.]
MMLFEDFGVKEKKILLLLLSALLSFWLVFAPVTSAESAMPEKQTVAMYQITEPELVQLETNLAQLKSINSRLQMDLKVQSDEATALKQEVTKLKRQLEKLLLLSQTQGESLTNANKLLAEYATEAKRERLRIKAQRNTWEAVAACLVIALAVK